jgi:hypothetical protein
MKDKSSGTGRLATGTMPPDSDGLGAIVGDNFAIGAVPEVNGEGAVEERGYVPTRHELMIIARYWLKEVRTIEFDWFFCGCFGSTDMRVRPYGYRRLRRIEQILGADAIEILDREINSEFEAEVGPRLWKMFLEGEEPERDQRGVPVLPPLPD